MLRETSAVLSFWKLVTVAAWVEAGDFVKQVEDLARGFALLVAPGD